LPEKRDQEMAAAVKGDEIKREEETFLRIREVLNARIARAFASEQEKMDVDALAVRASGWLLEVKP
jgi:hypothetical protein